MSLRWSLRTVAATAIISIISNGHRRLAGLFDTFLSLRRRFVERSNIVVVVGVVTFANDRNVAAAFGLFPGRCDGSGDGAGLFHDTVGSRRASISLGQSRFCSSGGVLLLDLAIGSDHNDSRLFLSMRRGDASESSFHDVLTN